MITAQIDHQTVEAAVRGEEWAIQTLLVQTQKDLKRFARRSCNSAEDAEDAVQVALWRLHQRVGTLRSIQAFSTWLFRIVERECRRLFRLGSYTDSLDVSDVEQLPNSAVPSDLRQDLTRAIQTLPEMYREVLILRDIEELTAPEVSLLLNVSVEAVKSRLHRARGMLREKLINSGYWFSGS